MGSGKSVTNPPFDKRILRLAQVSGGPTKAFQRGFITTAVSRNPSVASASQNRYRVNYLYNPSDLSVSHSVELNNNATALPTDLRSDADIGQVQGMTGANLQFSLLFDRTYEVANTDTWDRPESSMGCYADVAVMYGLCGIVEPNLTSSIQVPYALGQSPSPGLFSTTAPSANSEQVYGVMKLNPVFAVFCPVRVVDPTSRAVGVSMMRYYGYVSTLSVSYTHWSQRMVPVRCVITVGMSLLMTNKSLLEP